MGEAIRKTKLSSGAPKKAMAVFAATAIAATMVGAPFTLGVQQAEASASMKNRVGKTYTAKNFGLGTFKVKIRSKKNVELVSIKKPNKHSTEVSFCSSDSCWFKGKKNDRDSRFQINSFGPYAFNKAKKIKRVYIYQWGKIVKMYPRAFAGSNVRKIDMSTATYKLKKKDVRNSLKGSKVKTLIVYAPKSSKNFKHMKKIFSAKNCGKKVKVKSLYSA
jgi:hypothetical protein